MVVEQSPEPSNKVGHAWAIIGLILGFLAFVGFFIMQFVFIARWENFYNDLEVTGPAVIQILNGLGLAASILSLCLGFIQFRINSSKSSKINKKPAIFSAILGLLATIFILLSLILALMAIHQATS